MTAVGGDDDRRRDVFFTRGGSQAYAGDPLSLVQWLDDGDAVVDARARSHGFLEERGVQLTPRERHAADAGPVVTHDPGLPGACHNHAFDREGDAPNGRIDGKTLEHGERARIQRV